MTIELNREAIAQVTALPTVTEAGRSRLGADQPVAVDRSHADGQ